MVLYAMRMSGVVAGGGAGRGRDKAEMQYSGGLHTARIYAHRARLMVLLLYSCLLYTSPSPRD